MRSRRRDDRLTTVARCGGRPLRQIRKRKKGPASKRSAEGVRPGRVLTGGKIAAVCVLAAAAAAVSWRAWPSSTVAAKQETKSTRPAINVETPNHDFGTFWVGTEMRHSFRIGNAGPGVLRITAVKPACGCTATGEYPDSIPPGESGDFPFLLDTSGLAGRFQRAITIESNDPDTPRLKLELMGTAKQYIEISPRSAGFDTTYLDGPKKRVLRITNNAESPADIKLAPTTKHARFKFQLVEKKPGFQYELHVSTLTPYRQRGMLRGTAVLRTNVEAQKTISVRATVYVAGRLDVRPSRVLIQEPRSSSRPASRKPRSGTVTFRNHGPNPVKLLDAAADDPLIEVTIVPMTPGKRYEVKLRMPHDYLPPKKGRTLTLRTDDPEKPTLKVPIQRRKSEKPRPALAMRGLNVPTFEIGTKGGGELSDRTLGDGVTVLNFFAVNCPFCKTQLPSVESLRPEYQARGVRFVTVSQTMKSKRFSDEQVLAKLRELGVATEVVTDPDNRIGKLFRVTSYPTMFVVAKGGKIAAVNIGNVTKIKTTLKTQLDKLLAGK